MKKLLLLFSILITQTFCLGQFIDVITNLQGNPFDIVVHGDYIYFTEQTSGTITKLDYTNQFANESYLVQGLTWPRGLDLQGDTLFVNMYYGNRISLIDLSSQNPQLIDITTNVQFPVDIAVRDSFIYFIEEPYDSSAIKRINYKSGSSIIEVFNDDLFDPTRMNIHNDLLYVADINEKIYSFDLTQSNPSPQLILNIGHTAGGMNINGDTMYLTIPEPGGNGLIYKFDLTSSGPPNLVTVAQNLDRVFNTVFVQNDLYFAQYDSYRISKLEDEVLSTMLLPQDRMSVYPNPTNDNIVLDINVDGSYTIYDNIGTLVSSGNTHNRQINVSSLSQGVYLLKLEDGCVARFIVQR